MSRLHGAVALLLTALLAALVLAGHAAAQTAAHSTAQQADDARLAEAVAANRAALGIPTLPAPGPRARADHEFYADRLAPTSEPAEARAGDGGDAAPVLKTFLANTPLPMGIGTAFTEIIYYQVPDGYSPVGTPIPLVIAYHGFGQSAQSVHVNSTIDEECNARGWFYISVTGIDDQLYGTENVQKNIRGTLLWAMANYNIDPDRIYAVGFSLGGGILASFASRHRDPDDVMIAALGAVAAGYDATASYNLGDAALQSWLQQPFNFGGPPASNPFAYKKASTLYFDPATYPPTPGTLIEAESAATNLHSTPFYSVWDLLDTGTAPKQNPRMRTYLQSLGAPLDFNGSITGISPPGNHSWAILDEGDLFDFFTGRVVDRYPTEVFEVADRATKVSYIDVDPIEVNQFAELHAVSDPGTGHLTVDNVNDVRSLTIHMDEAGITGTWPVRVTASNVDARDFDLILTGFDLRPCYLLDWTTGALITGVDSDPATDSLIVTVPGSSTLDVKVIHDPFWTADLWTTPDPAIVNAPITLEFDAPADGFNVVSVLFVSSSEMLVDIFGGQAKITAGFAPPWFLLVLPLDANGDVTINDTIPNNPALHGARVVLQGVQLDSLGELASVTNLWGLYVD